MATTRQAATGSASLLDAALIARRYYLDGKQKSEIAQELGISRFKVARLLDEARAAGIVEISIKVPTDVDLDLGERLAAAYGLRRAIVVNVGSDDEEAIAAGVGQAGADYLAGLLTEDDVLGLAWGRSLTAMADSLQGRTGADAVQLVGGLRAAGPTVSGVELVRRVAERTGGDAFPMHAPLVVGSVEMSQELLADPALAEARGRFGRLTVGVFGVGSWDPPQSALLDELPPDARQELRAAGVVADMCGIPIDAQGREVRAAAAGRIVGIRLEELRRAPELIALAGGVSRVKAIAAALRSGAVTTLVTDARAANALI